MNGQPPGAMRVIYTPEQRALRDAVCAFLRRELTPAARREHHDSDQLGGWSVPFSRAFHRRLGEAGFIGLSWPVEYGGQGRDPALDAIVVREIEYHRGPSLDTGTISFLPRSLLRYGDEAQRRAFLPRLARGEIEFFLGYSEPEAGSDLAALQLRAEAHGDTFLLRGQKAFSSSAHMADYGWVAARTDPKAPKHRGISLFIVDMRGPGITITASRTAGGWLHHAVYFDDVEVPRTMLVGELNAGWRLIMGALDHERAMLASPGAVAGAFDELLAATASRLREDAVAADLLARLAIESEVVALSACWLETLREAGREPQEETSLALIFKRETQRAIEAAALQLFGPFAPLQAGSPYAPADGAFEQDERDHLYYHFAAGGFDITRNVIAARGLGLPR
ncbi:MAG TPA: acyl-CoA dehydrogenase family protein [Dehalococcoidia bacterium]|nr:acyl-CoA dehydrogenase family protein [Dehalococcoidia bacterium]